MSTIPVTEANLYRLIAETKESHDPVLITGKRGNAVLVAEEDWHAIMETLCLKSVPGLNEAIKEGMATPIDECSEDLGW